MYNITILTEVGRDIGFGHYMRCSSLYQALKKVGCEVRFIVYENEYNINDKNVISFDWLKSIDSISPITAKEIAIIDSYLANENIYMILSKKFSKNVVIDDYNRIIYKADLLINPNVFFEDVNYSNQKLKCIGGKNFVILRPEFINSDSDFLVDEKIKNILITIGGSDFRNILLKLVSMCHKFKDIKITVLDPESKIISKHNIHVLTTRSSFEMVLEIQNADLIISACGQTLHELVALQKPTIGICLDIDQEPNQKFYFRNGFLNSSINWNDEDMEHKILDQINYYNMQSNRLKVKQVCKNLIDKNGVYNIVDFLKHEIL